MKNENDVEKEEEIEELQTKSIAEYVKERRERNLERKEAYEEKIKTLKEKTDTLKRDLNKE